MSWPGFEMLNINQERGSNKGLVQKWCGSILSVYRYKTSLSSHNNDLLSLHYPSFTLLHL